MRIVYIYFGGGSFPLAQEKLLCKEGGFLWE